MYNSIFVLVVCCPYRYFVSLCSDVDDGTTDIITVVIKCFSHKAQKLKKTTKKKQNWGRASKPSGSMSTQWILQIMQLNRLDRVQTYRLQPEAVQVGSALLFGQGDQPAAALLVSLIFPHGLNAILLRKVQKDPFRWIQNTKISWECYTMPYLEEGVVTSWH